MGCVLLYANSSGNPHPEAKLDQIDEYIYFLSLAGGYMSHLVRMMDGEQMMCKGKSSFWNFAHF